MYLKKKIKMSDSEIDVIINDQSSGKPRLLFSCRFLIALILFLGASIQYIQKIDMGNLILQNVALIQFSCYRND